MSYQCGGGGCLGCSDCKPAENVPAEEWARIEAEVEALLQQAELEAEQDRVLRASLAKPNK